MKPLITVSLLSIALVSLSTAPSVGATTCVRSKTVIFELRRNTAPTSVTTGADKTFTATYDYSLMPTKPTVRSLSGMATCNEINTDTSGNTVTSGSANTHLRTNYDNSDTGTYCWCSFTGPISTWWVYLRSFESDDACDSGCASACADAIRNDTNGFRTSGMYNAIW